MAAPLPFPPHKAGDKEPLEASREKAFFETLVL